MEIENKQFKKTKHSNGLTIAIFIIAILFSFPDLTRSEFYRYVTDGGKTYYVDDLTRIPEKYRDQLKVYRERYDHLSDNERMIMLQNDRNLDQNRALEEKRLREKQEKEELLKHLETDVIIMGNQVLVPVTIGHGIVEREALFLLDTGATNLVLFREFARQFDIKSKKKSVSKVAGGGLLPSELAILDFVKVGPMRVNSAHATIIENMKTSGVSFGFSGLLGMNILRNIKYTIDFEKKKIHWKLPPK